jgi:predicted anti-sigma-YlaC factor YlaD
MKCKDIRESLLTDYPDGQLNTERVGEIEQHLSSCVQCRKFSDVVCISLVEPFTGAKKISLSQEKVWDKITQLIKEEQAQTPLSNPFVDMIRRVRQAITVTKPAFALLTIAVIALIVMVYFNTMSPEEADHSPSSESGTTSISYVADELSDHQSDDNVDYGTDIERYFL